MKLSLCPRKQKAATLRGVTADCELRLAVCLTASVGSENIYTRRRQPTLDAVSSHHQRTAIAVQEYRDVTCSENAHEAGRRPSACSWVIEIGTRHRRMRSCVAPGHQHPTVGQ